MIDVGKFHTLEVIKHLDFGVILQHEEEEILLPKKYLPEDVSEWELGESIEVFVYLDSEDRPIATTEIPEGCVGDTVLLQVIGQSDFGTFMDWGLLKDLLVPFKEQNKPMNMNRFYVVHIFIDKSNRIAASTKLSKFLQEENEEDFEFREEVDILICGRSDLGYKAVINNSHLGLIHQNDVVRPLKDGDEMKAYIGELREDGRINLKLQKLAHEMRGDLSEQIISYLKDHGGIIGLTDKSPPAEINEVFHVSKSNYKKALGKLFKEGKITFHQKSVRLVKEDV
ncbi:MAG: S1-like domain-containing RNA-binding protein [Emcibacteraceae bacterium]|nr:S1-like domain-containing RNA-binding protein [Emcibacteraceae bacterium]MDG1996967.1 S1-like domain-containing RNA-binding protein [Emcibacteraceae bacterium]